jgi:hypothetical protein
MMTFDHVDSPSALAAEADAGTLRPALLFPQELGGQAVAENIVYLPDHAIQAQTAAIEGLLVAIRQGLTEVSIAPEYKGKSLVPARIQTSAGKPGAVPQYRFENAVW